MSNFLIAGHKILDSQYQPLLNSPAMTVKATRSGESTVVKATYQRLQAVAADKKNGTSFLNVPNGLRESVRITLEDFGVPVYLHELIPYLKAKWGEAYSSVGPRRVEKLVESDRRRAEGAFARPGRILLCPALTADRGEAIARLLTLSVWPLAERLVAPTTGRIQHLRVTVRLCEMASEEIGSFADRGALLKLVSVHARGLPETSVEYGKYDLVAWSERARRLLKKHGGADGRIRRDCDRNLKFESECHRLYGAPEDAREEVDSRI